MSKPQWVCIICAEDFTRKSSGKRHRDNTSIHNERPIIVRYTEYIIGRVKRDYPPPIIPPRLQRRKTNKQYEPRHCTITHDDNSTFDPSAIIDNKLDPLSYSNVVPPMMRNKNSKRLYQDSDATEQQLDIAVHKEQSWSLTESQDTLLSKFEKIKKLSGPYFSSERVDVILTNLARQVFYDGGNDYSVDEYLVELRQKVNQMEAFNHLSPSKRPMSSTDISEQRMQQASVDNPSFQDLDEAARIKLAEIEEVLTPYCPPEFVRNVITGLTKQYNMTGDHSILDEALERHRRNAKGYAIRN